MGQVDEVDFLLFGWIPAFAGMTEGRGFWIKSGMTEGHGFRIKSGMTEGHEFWIKSGMAALE